MGLSSIAAHVCVFLILMYKRAVSPFLPASCRFYPSCSDYALQSVRRFGPWKGSWLALLRIGRCHPFNPGGLDPVPTASETPQE